VAVVSWTFYNRQPGDADDEAEGYMGSRKTADSKIHQAPHFPFSAKRAIQKANNTKLT
jgi:hypothetical protein